jgi:hypothetical protein
MKRVVIITAIIAVVSIVIAGIIGLATGSFSISRTLREGGIAVDERGSIAAGGIDLIEIHSVSENIRLIEGEGDGIDAWLHGTIHVSSPELTPRLVVDARGSIAEVRIERKRKWAIGFDWSDLVLEVSLPKGYAGRLSAESVSGDLEAADHAYAGLTLATTSGDARLGSMKAKEIVLRTISGDLQAKGAAAGRVVISTVSGDVNLGGLAGDARVRTTSGDMRLAFASVAGAVDIASTSGEVMLLLPADAGFSLEARSTSGEIVCSFPILLAESRSGGGSHVIVGRVGDGAHPVSVRTVSGDIRIAR